MEASVKKCIKWGIVLIVVGGFVLLLLPLLIGLLAESAGPTAAIGVGAVELVLNFVRWALIPMGTTLIGAAIVIRVLAPALERSSENHASRT
jgi:hypothetical protein